MTERTEWTFLGRVIGTATGWDGEMESFILYEFEPAHNIDLPKCDLSILIHEGLFQSYSDDGTVLWSKDIITTLGVVA